MKNLQIALKGTIYVDSTGADNTVSIALYTHSFPRSGPKN